LSILNATKFCFIPIAGNTDLSVCDQLYQP
jgi:hypothetical protein